MKDSSDSQRGSIFEAWSRRTFLKRGVGLGALAAFGGAILQACGTTLAPSAGIQATKEAPKAVRGGNVVEAPSVEDAHLNPILLPRPSLAGYTMFDSLLTLTADGQLTPLLATALPRVSADSLTYTFDLRKDVKWTDGTQLTAADVVFTYSLMYHPDYKVTPSPYRGSLESLIDAVSAPDPYTVVIKTKRVNAAFLAFHSAYGILPKHVLGNVPAAALKGHPYNRAPTVTSGPMKFKEWIPGDHQTFVRNDACYRGTPNIDSYVVKYLAQQTAYPTALKTGEIDAASITNPLFFEDMKSSPNLNVTPFLAPSSAPRIGYNLDPAAPASKMFSSKAVRQALLYGADRAGAAKATLVGYSVKPSSAGTFIVGSWANNPDAKPTYDYDKRKAEDLLEADGWKRGASGIREKNGVPLKFEMLTSAANATWQQIAQIFQQNWKEIGVECAVRPLQYAQVLTASLAHEFDMTMIAPAYAVNVDPDPSATFHSRNAVKNGGQNYMSYKNPQVDSLLDQAVATVDQAKRKQLYFQVQDILNDEVPFWSSWGWQSLWVSNKRLQWTGPNRIGPSTSGNRTFINEWYVTDGK